MVHGPRRVCTKWVARGWPVTGCPHTRIPLHTSPFEPVLPRANIRMGAQAAPFRRFSRVCVGEARLLRPARARGFRRFVRWRHVYHALLRLANRSPHWVAPFDTTQDFPLAIPQVAAHAATFLRSDINIMTARRARTRSAELRARRRPHP